MGIKKPVNAPTHLYIMLLSCVTNWPSLKLCTVCSKVYYAHHHT